MTTKTPGKKFQASKRKEHLFPSHHTTLKRSEREDGKALEKVHVVADQVVAESLEKPRTNSCVNLNFITKVQNECMFLKFFSLICTFMKIEQYFRPNPLE